MPVCKTPEQLKTFHLEDTMFLMTCQHDSLKNIVMAYYLVSHREIIQETQAEIEAVDLTQLFLYLIGYCLTSLTEEDL